MLRFICLLLLAAIPALAAKMTVAVSLQPYLSVVEEIGGSQVEAIAMLPPGADPHTYEPKPASLKEFAKATVYFSDGSGMDAAWLPRFLGVNRNVSVVSLSKDIVWMEEDEHHHDHAGHGEAHEVHHDEDEMDPHLWTSPRQMMTVARNVCDALVHLDSANADTYRARTEALVNRLKTLDGDLVQSVARLPEDGRAFIVFHPSYGYFARDYGMRQLTVEVNGKEPKPRDLFNLVKTGRANNCHIVFVQPQFSRRAASTIANELDAKVMATDPLAYDYEKNIRMLLETIRESNERN